MSVPFLILVVDDDPDLIDVLSRTAKHSFPEAHFIQVHSSLEAKDYFDKLEGYGPKLILLDLALQEKTTGLDFLTYLRANSQTRSIPVIILTVSQRDSDIQEAYAFGVSSFTQKPFSTDDWMMYWQNLRLYWFNTVTLPPVRFTKNR
ncbi:response regulator [Spirosoma koreense]